MRTGLFDLSPSPVGRAFDLIFCGGFRPLDRAARRPSCLTLPSLSPSLHLSYSLPSFPAPTSFWGVHFLFRCQHTAELCFDLRVSGGLNPGSLRRSQSCGFSLSSHNPNGRQRFGDNHFLLPVVETVCIPLSPPHFNCDSLVIEE